MTSIFNLFFASLLSLATLASAQNVSMRAWVEDGYYFSHRCQITIEIISNYFESSYQLFHVIAKQNAYFFNTVEYSNVFYVKGTNQMQTIMTSSETYCKFPMSTTYYCPFISISGYDPYGLKYFQKVNSTHQKLIIRLSRPICPQQGKTMSFRIQMPIASDYNQFYMYIPDINNTTQISFDKLSFVYDKQVIVDLAELKYKQVQEIMAIPQKIFIVGCQFVYSFVFKMDNVSYFNSWDEIDVYVSNISLTKLSTNCSSNMSLKYSCQKTSYGFRLMNLEQVDMIKSYEIADQQYYEYDPFIFSLSFGIQFIDFGDVSLQVLMKANNNGIQESFLNMSHNKSQIYGRKIVNLQSYNVQQFVKISSSNKYAPQKCIVPIYINSDNTNINQMGNMTNTNTNGNNTQNIDSTNITNVDNNEANTTNNTANNSINPDVNDTTKNNTQTNNNVVPEDFTFDTTVSSFQINHLLFISLTIVVVSLTLFCTQKVSSCQAFIYLLSLFILIILKMLYLILQVDQSWLESLDQSISESMISQSRHSYSLQLFILKNTFYFQLFLNLFYFFKYLIILLCSQQVKERIRKFYGSKFYLKNTIDNITSIRKINKCNFSSVLFSLITFLTFTASFKIYAILILKLQLYQHSFSSQFKKYRFKNSVLYKIHIGHLAIDLILECNALIWLFMLIKNSQSQILTYSLILFLLIYCVNTFLMAIFLKVFILMAKKTDQFNRNQRIKIKNTSINLLTSNSFEENQKQNHQIQSNNLQKEQQHGLTIEQKESKEKTEKSPIQTLLNLSSK